MSNFDESEAIKPKKKVATRGKKIKDAYFDKKDKRPVVLESLEQENQIIQTDVAYNNVAKNEIGNTLSGIGDNIGNHSSQQDFNRNIYRQNENFFSKKNNEGNIRTFIPSAGESSLNEKKEYTNNNISFQEGERQISFKQDFQQNSSQRNCTKNFDLLTTNEVNNLQNNQSEQIHFEELNMQKNLQQNVSLSQDNNLSYNQYNQNLSLQNNFPGTYQDRKNRPNFWQQKKDKNYAQQQEEEYVINPDKVIYVKDLRDKKLEDLIATAEQYQVPNLSRMLKPDIITAILRQATAQGESVYADGCLEIIDEGGFGFLRDSENNYKASSYDVYISQSYIKKFGLRQGDCIGAYIKEPRRSNEKFFSIALLDTINGKKISEIKNKINFDNLTPLYPNEKLRFDKMVNKNEAISTRVIDLICPIGKGQRALIVAPPRAGKTFLMQAVAHAINENHPESELIVLLIDERPEEVTDMVRSVKGEVVSSTFDEPAKRHVELAEIVIEKAKRMVEDGKDVIILLDSITRLARAYNAIAPSSGKVLTGGVDSNALQKPKRFFGAARNIENGGSLTIIATALVETGSKMDEVIFEEFKGTGNAEIVLDRKLAEKRLFPAVDILKSGTRKEEEMVAKEDLTKMWILRRILIQMAGTANNNTADALEFLLDKLKNSSDNKDFFAKMNGPK